MAISTRIQDVFCSSTRAELSGIFLALQAPYPVHISCDSQAAVNRVHVILAGTLSLDSKPWGLRQHGDILQLIQRVIATRPPNSTKIPRTNAHATKQHLDKGIITHQDKLGNETADGAATGAQDLHNDLRKELSRLYRAILYTREDSHHPCWSGRQAIHVIPHWGTNTLENVG